MELTRSGARSLVIARQRRYRILAAGLLADLAGVVRSLRALSPELFPSAWGILAFLLVCRTFTGAEGNAYWPPARPLRNLFPATFHKGPERHPHLPLPSEGRRDRPMPPQPPSPPLQIKQAGDATIVRFTRSRTLGEGPCQTTGEQLFRLVEDEGRITDASPYCPSRGTPPVPSFKHPGSEKGIALGQRSMVAVGTCLVVLAVVYLSASLAWSRAWAWRSGTLWSFYPPPAGLVSPDLLASYRSPGVSPWQGWQRRERIPATLFRPCTWVDEVLTGRRYLPDSRWITLGGGVALLAVVGGVIVLIANSGPGDSQFRDSASN